MIHFLIRKKSESTEMSGEQNKSYNLTGEGRASRKLNFRDEKKKL